MSSGGRSPPLAHLIHLSKASCALPSLPATSFVLHMLSTGHDKGAYLNVEHVEHIMEIRIVHMIGPVSSRVWQVDVKVCRRHKIRVQLAQLVRSIAMHQPKRCCDWRNKAGHQMRLLRFIWLKPMVNSTTTTLTTASIRAILFMMESCDSWCS